MNEPTEQQWLDLHEAFREYCQAAPWQWFDDTYMVVIQHPSTAEAGYCVVLGSGGLEYGLAVYRGDEGLAGYLGIMSGAIEVGSFESLDMTNALSAMLADREDLTKEERDTIRSLGLRYRGRGRWPLFQDVRPGYMPWQLDGEGAVFLTWALRGMIDVTAAVANGEVSLDAELSLDDGDSLRLFLTRTWGDGRWNDSWGPLLFPLPPPVPDYPDTDRLRELASSKPASETVWELAITYFHAPLGDESDDRLHFPVLALLVETESEFLLQELFMKAGPSDADRQELLVKMLETLPAMPSEIVVSAPRMALLVESVTAPLGMKLSVDETPLVWGLRDELFARLNGQEPDDLE